MNKTSWIVAAVSAAVALMLGFGAGWFGNQAYIRASLNAAFEDIGGDIEDASMPEDMEAMEENPEEAASEDLPDAVPMGEAASDGIWDITVTGVERVDQVNGSYSNAVAGEGWEFVILDVEMVNTSNGPQAPEIDNSQITDTDGNRYGYHSEASFALDEDDALYTEVNPNGTAELRIPFEMEADTTADLAFLTGTWDSTGVAVTQLEE